MNALKFWIPALFWMGVIFILSTDPFGMPATHSTFEEIIHSIFPFLSERAVYLLHVGVRKVAHLSVYAMLSVTYALAFSKSIKPWNTWTPSIGAATVALCLLYGVTDEFHQHFSRTRTATPMDVLWDALGAGIAQICFWIRYKSLRFSRSLASNPPAASETAKIDQPNSTNK